MTSPTQSQIRDAISKAYVHSEKDDMGCIIRQYIQLDVAYLPILQSALDTQKPTGDAFLPCPFCGINPAHDHEEGTVFCSHDFCCAFGLPMDCHKWNSRAALTGDCGGGDRLQAQIKYSAYLQQIIEAICHERPIPVSESLALHHYRMAVEYADTKNKTEGIKLTSDQIMKITDIHYRWKDRFEDVITPARDGMKKMGYVVDIYNLLNALGFIQNPPVVKDIPQPVEEIEGLEEAITMSASACYMNGVRAYYDTAWIEALVEASRRYLALTSDNAKRGE